MSLAAFRRWAGRAGVPRWHLNYKRVKIGLQWNADDWLIGQLLRWLMPWSSIYNSTLKGIRDQPANFVALQRHKFFLGIIFVKLRTKINSVNSWIISFHNEEVLRSRPNIVCFLIFRSCVAQAIRSLSGEGPIIVPASNKMTQSLLVVLSGWIRIR